MTLPWFYCDFTLIALGLDYDSTMILLGFYFEFTRFGQDVSMILLGVTRICLGCYWDVTMILLGFHQDLLRFYKDVFRMLLWLY